MLIESQPIEPVVGEVLPANEFLPAASEFVPNLAPMGIQNHEGGFNVPSEIPEAVVPEAVVPKEVVPKEVVPKKVAPKVEAISDYFRKK